MKIRDSFSKETLKQFKSIAPNSNRKLDGTIIPLDEEFEIPESESVVCFREIQDFLQKRE